MINRNNIGNLPSKHNTSVVNEKQMIQYLAGQYEKFIKEQQIKRQQILAARQVQNLFVDSKPNHDQQTDPLSTHKPYSAISNSSGSSSATLTFHDDIHIHIDKTRERLGKTKAELIKRRPPYLK